MPFRIRSTPFALAATLAATALISTGCVTPEKYNALRIERDGLNEQLARASSEAAQARAQAVAWKTQLDALNNANGSKEGVNANLMQQVTSLHDQLNDITNKYNDALARIGSSGTQLPAELTNELTNFADQNPNLVEFDSKTGTVKFKSDLTFPSGDATIQSGAQGAIASFAQILNSEAAKGYELMVCGYADNQPVSAPTIARGHKDNWYLSSHRALSVAEALKSRGVSPNRIGAVGYGEYRPIASNDTPAGKAQNRRVEVLILPTQIAANTQAAQPAANANTQAPKTEVTVQRHPEEDSTK